VTERTLFSKGDGAIRPPQSFRNHVDSVCPCPAPSPSTVDLSKGEIRLKGYAA